MARFISTAELADMLGLKYRTVKDNWRDWGLKAHKFGKHLRFDIREVEKWIEAHDASD